MAELLSFIGSVGSTTVQKKKANNFKYLKVVVCEKKLSARATSLFVKRRTSFLQEDALWNSKISLPGTWNNSTKKKKNELTQSEKNLFVILHGRWKPHQEMHTKYSSSFTVKPNLFSPFTLKYKSSIAFHFVLTVNVKEVAYLETCILLEKKKEVRFRKQLFPRNMSGARQACGFWEIHGCTKGYAPGVPMGYCTLSGRTPLVLGNSPR